MPPGEVALLLHLDDLGPDTVPLGTSRVAGLLVHADDAADRVRASDETAMQDGLQRAGARFDCPVVPFADGWSGELPIVTPWAPVGPTASVLPAGVLRVRRRWDEAAWPLSQRGYFKLRTAIPDVLGAGDTP